MFNFWLFSLPYEIFVVQDLAIPQLDFVYMSLKEVILFDKYQGFEYCDPSFNCQLP